MSDSGPTRSQNDLAEMLELVLDKGIVINADIAVSVGDTELLGIELRAAIASFETAAEYGLAFPSGTDMQRVEQASGREPLEARTGDDEIEIEGDDGGGGRGEVDLGIDASEGGSHPPRARPDPEDPKDDREEGDAEDSSFENEDADTANDRNESESEAENT